MLIGTWITTVFISGVSLIYILVFISIFSSYYKFVTIFNAWKFGYIIDRLVSFIDPSKGDKFQSSSALDAIKLGGLKGQGMGEGILKDSVPEAHTDYIIAIISEEYGSIISIIIILIFLYISFRIIKNLLMKKMNLLKSLYVLSYIIDISNIYHVGVNTSLNNNRHDLAIPKLWRSL